MKILSITLLTAVLASTAYSQTGAFPPAFPGLPGSRGFPPTPQYPGSGHQAPIGNGGIANFNGGTVDQSQLPLLLEQVQRSIEQALPSLATLNNRIAGSGGLDSSPDLGRFSNSVDHFGNPLPGVPGSGRLAVDPSRTGALAQGGVTNSAAMLQVNADTLRALLILQSDLERALPILAAINGGSTGGLVTPGSSVATNTTGTGALPATGRPPSMVPGVPVVTPGGQPAGLTPTGR